MNAGLTANLATGGVIALIAIVLILADPPIAGIWVAVSLAYSSRKKRPKI